MPEVKIGYAPDVGTSYVLARLDGETGTYLALTGETIKGYEVFRLGLATHFVSSRRLPALFDRLGALEDPVPKAINATIEEFHSEPDSAADEASQLTISKGDVRLGLDLAFAHKDVEGIIGVLESFAQPKKSAEETSEPSEVQNWATRTLEAIESRSPTSLRIALEAVRRARKDDFRLSDALQMELGIATAFCSGASPDFITGVTSVLINKEKMRPNWSPSTLAEVSQDWVLSTFFSRESKYVSSAPRIHTPRTSASVNLGHFGLPTEVEIGAVIRGSSPDSGASAVDVEELVARFEARTDGKRGVRSKVEEVIARRCEKMEGGYLRWKY